MSVEKLVINYEEDIPGKYSGRLVVGFNPSQFTIASNVKWEHVPPPKNSKDADVGKTVFREIVPDTLTVHLFFDTYAPYSSNAAGGVLGAANEPPKSVATVTSRVQALTRIRSKLGRPPTCELTWGMHTIFRGVLTQASQTFTLFLPDGTPVRATMECSFMEVIDSVTAGDAAGASDAQIHVVKPGDTLMSIAAARYGDQSQWRLIAKQNGIENPLEMTSGQPLTIPKVK